MQYQIETVDPKLLDLRHFPLPSSRQLFTAQDEASKLQGGGQDLKGDDIDLSLHSKSIYARRRSSIDQLDILGQFEFSFSCVYRLLPTNDGVLANAEYLAQPKNPICRNTYVNRRSRHILRQHQMVSLTA